MQINYIKRDLFKAIQEKTGPLVIPHVCNCERAFGAGFVLPLTKYFPQAKEAYLNGSMQLGEISVAKVGNVTICNMIAQELGGARPLFYNFLARCMDKVATDVLQSIFGYEICAPAFGSGLAKGDFGIIKELIHDCWVRPFENDSGFKPINIYYLPGTFIPPGANNEWP